MRGKTLKPNLKETPKGKSEPSAGNIAFKVHKFTKRQKPQDPRNIVIFPCFSEFGTEILGTVYCLPALMQQRYMGKYSIAMGWQGREFLYRNIVDEFWEIDESCMWLREYARAFHHESKNLANLEREVAKQGRVVGALEIGEPAVYPKLGHCLLMECKGEMEYSDRAQKCKKCGCSWPPAGYFYGDLMKARENAVWPKVDHNKLYNIEKYVKPNMVGITARNRACYNRNLPPIFYERLIYQLEDMGYNPIWIGEKQSTHPCPFPRITDFTVTEEAKDLENTLALVSQLRFTIQFWTASTRLAGLVGTPYILFESPDQIYGGTLSPGHEGYRLYLCTRGSGKLVLTHYNSVADDHNYGLKLAQQAVSEVEANNFQNVIGATYGYRNK